MTDNFKRALKYCFIYVIIFNVTLTILTSTGVFFHFILKHEISIIESWLHLHGWKILIFSKLISFYFFYKILQMRLYQINSLKVLWDEFPDKITKSPVVIAIYMWLAFFIWGQPEFTSNNLTYIFELIASVFGISIFFLIDLVVLMILFNTFDLRSQTLAWKHFLIFPAILSLSLLIGVQDYYQVIVIAILNLFSLFIFLGPKCENKKNALLYLFLFVAPSGSMLGMDFLWGHEYTFLKLSHMPSTSFLMIIWMISWSYHYFITYGLKRRIDSQGSF